MNQTTFMNQSMDEESKGSGGGQKLADYLAAAKRRRRSVVIIFAVGILTSILLAVMLPSRYQSTGTILIEQQEMPSDLVRSTVTSYADQRVQIISQRVMTTQNLLSIIHRYDLYPHEQSRQSREQLIERMRNDIQFKMISADVVDPRSGAPRKATIAFTVAYTSSLPDAAAKVANELTTLYLNENLTERNRMARDAFGFLQTEGDRLSTQIQEVDSRLATFKQKHFDELPELAQTNMQQLDRAEQRVRDAESRRNSLEQQLIYLTAQFAQLKPDSAIYSDTGERIQSPTDRLKSLRAKFASLSALYSPDHPDVVRMKREIEGLEAQVGPQAPRVNDLRRSLEDKRGELAELQKKYSPDHPDVQKLERQVAQLETEVAKATEQVDKTAGATPGDKAVAGSAVPGVSGPDATAPGTAASGTAAPAQSVAPSGAAAPGASSTRSAATAGGASTAAAATGGTPAPGATAASTATLGSDNPAYIQVATSIDTVRSEIASLDAVIAQERAHAGEYQHKLSLAPGVEKEYRELTRDSESAQLKYREIRSKEMEAQVAENLESDRKGERFTLIEPPLPPEDPVSPNRPLLLTVGLLLSLALAAGAVSLLEATDATVRGRKDMMEAFGTPMLALVPRIRTAADVALGRRRLRYALGTSAAVLIASIAAVHFFYRPLDVLWFAAMRHIGY